VSNPRTAEGAGGPRCAQCAEALPAAFAHGHHGVVCSDRCYDRLCERIGAEFDSQDCPDERDWDGFLAGYKQALRRQFVEPFDQDPAPPPPATGAGPGNDPDSNLKVEPYVAQLEADRDRLRSQVEALRGALEQIAAGCELVARDIALAALNGKERP